MVHNIAGNPDVFVAIINLTATEAVSSHIFNKEAEEPIDLDLAAQELEELLEEVKLPCSLFPLVPFPKNHGEDSYTSDTSEVIGENLEALKELLGRA